MRYLAIINIRRGDKNLLHVFFKSIFMSLNHIEMKYKGHAQRKYKGHTQRKLKLF